MELDYLIAAVIGVGAGVTSGLFGVGGGIVFVPALAFVLGLGQAEAEATSLLAIVPVALVGAWRQNEYGNVKARTGLLIGVLAIPGAIAGAWVATELSDATLELLFAGLCLYVAWRMARRAMQPEAAADSDPAGAGTGAH